MAFSILFSALILQSLLNSGSLASILLPALDCLLRFVVEPFVLLFLLFGIHLRGNVGLPGPFVVDKVFDSAIFIVILVVVAVAAGRFGVKKLFCFLRKLQALILGDIICSGRRFFRV